MRRRKHPNDRLATNCGHTYCWPWLWPRHRGVWSGVKYNTNRYWRAQRAREREALSQGLEPEPARPRHSARWVLF